MADPTTTKVSGIASEVFWNNDQSPVGTVVALTPVCDTSAYTAGDVLFATTEVPGALRSSGGSAELQSVVLIDEDDNTAAVITLFFFRSATGLLGAFNNAPDIDDTEVREFIGAVPIAAADFIDVTASKIATVKNVGLMVYATTGTSVWVAATCAGTPTQTASGIKLRLGFRWQ